MISVGYKNSAHRILCFLLSFGNAPKDFMFRSKAPQFIGILRCEFFNQQKGDFMKLQSAQLNFAGPRIFVESV
jgi:hypothetical protein